MTLEQIRTALTHMEANRSLALDANDYGLADAFQDKVLWLREELIRMIRAEDPYTSAADIAYFEGWAG